MLVHLNDQEHHDWYTAVKAVEQTAANTDSEAGSKPHLNALAGFVRNDPPAVLRMLRTA
jgi:hypothetical protein